MGFPTDIQPPGTEDIKLNTLNGRDEREEGEISDEFEDIISSDEEFSMRKRIEELEAKNLELEKIANISGTYNCDLGYPNDISHNGFPNPEIKDISDYPTTYYGKAVRSKKLLPTRKPKSIAKAIRVPEFHINNTLSNSTKNITVKIRRNLRSPPKHETSNKTRSRTRARKRKHDRSGRKKRKIKKKPTQIDNTSSDEYDCLLNRDELRLALKRDIKTPNLKVDFNKIVQENHPKLNDNKIDLSKVDIQVEDKKCRGNEKHDGDESTNSLEEIELRLIALKSAMFKKHLERKKRNEKPYSPTDFVHLIGVPAQEEIMSPKNSCDGDQSNAMDISPIGSPEYVNNDCILKPTDMDLASSSSSTSPICLDEINSWRNRNENIPPPIGVNHMKYENFKLIAQKSSDIEDECSSQLPCDGAFETNNLIVNEDEDIVEIHNINSSPEPIDEEEVALRAFLLAKLNSPKIKKEKLDNKHTVEKNEREEVMNVMSDENSNHFQSYNNNNSNDSNELDNSELVIYDHDNSLDADSLRNFLLSNMKEKHVNKTEQVLKEAVKRLKYQTQGSNNCSNNNSQCGELTCDMYLTTNDNSNSESCDITGDNVINIVNDDMNLISKTITNLEISTKIPVECTNDYSANSEYNNYAQNEIDLHVDSNSQTINSNNPENDKLPISPITEPNYEENSNRTKSGDEITSPITEENPNTIPLNDEKINENANDINEQLEEVNQDDLQIEQTPNSISTKETIIPNTHENLDIEKIVETKKIATIQKKLVSKQDIKHIKKPLKIMSKNSPKLLTKVIGRNSLIQIKAAECAKKLIETTQTTNVKPGITAVNNTKVINRNPLVPIKQTPLNSHKRKTNEIKNTTINSVPSRLVSSFDIRRKVQRIVINVGQTDSESDETELFGSGYNNDPIPKRIKYDYCDNASPESLQMESPCYSPAPVFNSNIVTAQRSPANSVLVVGNDEKNDTNTATECTEKQIEKNSRIVAVNDVFQTKLDEFLKNARIRVEMNKKGITNDTNTVQQTPVAVRHLPQSSQLEYRRLINRMKILEKQRQAKSKKIRSNHNSLQVAISNDKIVDATSKTINDNSTIIETIAKDFCNKTTTSTEATTNNNNNDDLNLRKSADKENIVMQNNSNSIYKNKNKLDAIATLSSNPTSESNTVDELEKYETEYEKTSTSLLENINKTLGLVKHAKEEKLKKFMLENELKQLKQQMIEVEKKLQIQNKKISEIYPEISDSHKIIVRLKEQHSQWDKLSNNLGKTIKGDDYKLKLDQKATIFDKSKQLATEIRNLKNLKRTNLKYDFESEKSKIDSKSDIENRQETPNSTDANEAICNVNESPMVDKGRRKENEKLSDNTVPNMEENSIGDKTVKEPETNDSGIMTNEKIPSQFEDKHNENELSHSMISKVSYSVLSTETYSDAKNEKKESTASLGKYISPLDHVKGERIINPNGIICPYQLMGQCDDKECKFEHLPKTNNS